jgi:hypothetical protein
MQSLQGFQRYVYTVAYKKRVKEVFLLERGRGEDTDLRVLKPDLM